MKRREGFTLLELMIVIGIIAMLAAMFLPTFARARQQAQRAVCMSNIRQVTQALTAYATDHEGVFLALDSPDAQTGMASRSDSELVIPALYPYVHDARVFHCPADPRDSSVSYAPNEILGGSWPAYVHPLKRYLQVLNSNSTYEVIEEFDLHPKQTYSAGGFVVEPAPSAEWIDTPAVVHGNGSCITFLDGHCEFWVWSDARTLAFPLGTHLVRTPGNLDLTRLQSVLGSN